MKRYTPSFGGNPRHLITPGGEKSLLADCTAANIPADGKIGYEKGCQLVVKDGGDGLAIYINTGTSTSCAFRPMLYGLDSSAVALAATVTEINRAADVSARSIAAGSTLTISEALHDGKTILLDTAAGCTITLPATPTIGMRVRFLVTVKPTSNQHRISAGSNTIAGVANILDLDAAAQVAYSATAGSTATFDMNGTTKGGLVGDWVELEAITAAIWAVNAQLRCPAGSNPATPFA